MNTETPQIKPTICESGFWAGRWYTWRRDDNGRPQSCSSRDIENLAPFFAYRPQILEKIAPETIRSQGAD